MPTAGILVIGNEILSGKVADTNSPYLCQELRKLGVDVERILTIPDVTEIIASEVRAMSQSCDFVFTSGGIGPTHDDLTIEGVAAAFGRKVERNNTLEERLRGAIGSDLTESQLKMANIPEGATLIDSDDKWFPLVVVENVYIFPGIPEALRRKFDSARDRFRGVPYVLKRVYVKQSETQIVQALDELLEEFPELILGSYPRIREESYNVLLTLESRDGDYVQRALDSLLGRLTPDSIHKVE
jgi:molybdenum cofactor synthesis domain-containing protein